MNDHMKRTRKPISVRRLLKAYRRDIIKHRSALETKERWNTNPLQIFGPDRLALSVSNYNGSMQEQADEIRKTIEDVRAHIQRSDKVDV